MKRVLPILVIACGGTAETPVVPPPVPVVEEAPLRPAPGLDLEHAPGVTDSTPAPRKPALPFDLASDRAVVKVSVPAPPRGGSVGFTFADDRQGWAARIPDAQQLPSVAYGASTGGDGRIYISGGFESVSFYALHATTGRIEWATTNLEDNGPTAAVTEGEDVLFNTESCTLFSLNAKTGKRNWFRYLGDPTLAQIAVADGIVYSGHPDKASGHYLLSAFRTKSGAPVWSRVVGAELLATPVISGDSIYASTIEGMTFRFDHRTGKQKWAKPLRATTAPWVVGDELFVTRRAGSKEQQIVVATDTGKVIREHRLSATSYAYDVPSDMDDWKKVWAFEGSRPVVDRGIHYIAMGNDVIASDAKSGEAIWHRRYSPNSSSGKSNARTLGSVALAGSTIVVSSRDGKVFGLDVDTGYTLWSYDIGKRVIAEPIVAKGWLYTTTDDGYVVALNVADKSLDGWHMFGGSPSKNGAVPPPPVKQTIEGTSAQVEQPAPKVVASVFAAPSPLASPIRTLFELDPKCENSVLCK